LEPDFKAHIVWLILGGDTEKALRLLAEHYGVNPPKIRVGLSQSRKKRTLGYYSTKNKTISVMNSDMLREPFVILHEFYHHLRTTPKAEHKGTEKYADRFATEFILAYKTKFSLNKPRGQSVGEL
jgi:Zn-dependent peptidase ImmA (M78 family)